MITLTYVSAIVSIHAGLSMGVFIKYLWKGKQIKRSKLDHMLSRPIDEASCTDISILGQKYPSCFDYFVESGIQELYNLVHLHATNVLSRYELKESKFTNLISICSWPLQDQCDLSNFQNIMHAVRANIETSQKPFSISHYVVSPDYKDTEFDVEYLAFREITDDQKLQLLSNELKILFERFVNIVF